MGRLIVFDFTRAPFARLCLVSFVSVIPVSELTSKYELLVSLYLSLKFSLSLPGEFDSSCDKTPLRADKGRDTVGACIVFEAGLMASWVILISLSFAHSIVPFFLRHLTY